MKKSIMTTLSLLALSACGGSGGSSIIEGPITSAALSIANVPDHASGAAAANAGLEAAARVDALGLTAPADFQRSGTASFSGSIFFNDRSSDPQATVSGGLLLAIDFADENNVAAIASNFFDEADTPVSGTLTMDGVEFDEGSVGGGFVGDLTGTLRNVGQTGVDNDYAYDFELGAAYYGDGVQGMLILGNGTAREVGTTDDVEITGAGTLERD